MKMAGYGYIPDLGDPRDYRFEGSASLPASVDLRDKMPPVWDQGQLGSCTAFALTAAMAYLHGIEGSQLWLYYEERKMEHDVRRDAGAQIRDGVKVLNKLGLPREEDWPYVPSKFSKAPPKVANENALGSRISTYKRLSSISDYCQCLAAGSPFVVGISVFESFESDEVAKTGIVPMPEKSEQMVGGHAVCVVGYTATGDFIVRNSWGELWGMRGYFILPYAYLASADLATDAWMIAG